MWKSRQFHRLVAMMQRFSENEWHMRQEMGDSGNMIARGYIRNNVLDRSRCARNTTELRRIALFFWLSWYLLMGTGPDLTVNDS